MAHYLNSSLKKAEIDNVRADILSGRTKLLYVAPESLNKEENMEFLKSVKISFYAIDEAHCISEWGHDFRPEYRKIRHAIETIGLAPVIALTATATDKVRTDIIRSLGIEDCAEFKSSLIVRISIMKYDQRRMTMILTSKSSSLSSNMQVKVVSFTVYLGRK